MVITARGRNAMDSLYAARDFRVNVLRRIQIIQLGGFLLAFVLSGLIFPVEDIPAGLRWLSNLVQARYYIVIVRDALLQGAGWPAVRRQLPPICAIGLVFYARRVAW